MIILEEKSKNIKKLSPKAQRLLNAFTYANKQEEKTEQEMKELETKKANNTITKDEAKKLSAYLKSIDEATKRSEKLHEQYLKRRQEIAEKKSKNEIINQKEKK